MTISSQTLAWLRQSAAVDGAAYSQVLLHLLERLEALEQESTCKQSLQVPPTPAAPPAPDHVNLIGFAYGREPWATWLRKGGCLESAHCELSDLMLAVLAKWGHPTTTPEQP